MKKDLSIEFLRLIATVGVVLNHVSICWPSFFGKNATDVQNMIFNASLSCASYAVPVFMMITGHLLMQKEYADYHTTWKYFKRIAILIIIFGSAFASMEGFFNTHQIGVKLFAQSVLKMCIAESWNHLWYLYMLLGIYLIYPWLHRLRFTPPHRH